MMQADTVSGKIREFLLKNFPLAHKRRMTNDDGLLDNGVIDSLGVLEIVTFLEHEFQIDVRDDELLPENFQSILSLSAFVQRKLNGACADPARQ